MRAELTNDKGGILVAAVGLPWMRDLAFGCRIVERLRERSWPSGVYLEDWSYGTITAFQQLSTRAYERVVFVSGTPRGRVPGTLHRDEAGVVLPSPEEIHARIGDGVMGCVSVDNLVVMGRFFDALPKDVVLVEAEPADDTWGNDLSPECAALLPAAEALIVREIQDVIVRGVSADHVARQSS